MKLGICSFSFHRMIAAGEMDFERYVQVCGELGCTQLDPWNAHLADSASGEATLHAGRNPSESQHLAVPGQGHLGRIKAAAQRGGLPFGIIAIDGAHVYEPTPEARAQNRLRAYGWLDAAAFLGAAQARIDAGGDRALPDEQFNVIVDGYADLVRYATARRIELLIENHWGPAIVPEQVQKICRAVPGLGLLYDTHNWEAGRKVQAQQVCAPLARATHIKTFEFDAQGNDVSADIPHAIGALRAAGYSGAWGIESVPRDGDEIGAAKMTMQMIRRLVA